MTIVVAISLLLYAYYEAPARSWLRKRWRGRPTPAVLAAQSPAS
jgi:peptidoglycan/LPS O-acetylase OafA/YrhL